MEDILFLCHRLPYPPIKGDKIRSWNIFRHLAERHRVHLGCFVDDVDDLAHIETLTPYCASQCIIPMKKNVQLIRGGMNLMLGRSFSAGYFAHGAISKWVQTVVAERNPKFAYVFCSAMAPYVLRFKDLVRVVDMVDVDSEKWRDYAATSTWPLKWFYAREARALLELERKISAECNATLLVSEPEAQLLRSLAPVSASHIHAVSNGVDCSYFDPKVSHANPYTPGDIPIVFSGAMDYKPNVDACIWFVREILPLLRNLHGARFFIVGANPTAQVKLLARDPEVVVTGRVPDMRPYLAHAAVIVAPLRIARGIQNKVLEGMAMGRPVIATAPALEGISAEEGVEIIRADSPQEFAEAITGVIRGTRGADIGECAYRRIQRDYSWSTTLRRLDDVLCSASGPKRSPEVNQAIIVPC